jgi:membrane-associated phospholipid phosphatase
MATNIPGGLQPAPTPAQAAQQLPTLQEEKQTHRSAIIRGAAAVGFTLSAFVLFGVMAVLIRGLNPLSFDVPITEAIQNATLAPVVSGQHVPFYDEFMEAISIPGYWPYNLVMMVVVLAGLLLLKRVVEAVFAAIAMGGVETIVELVKGFFARPRPSLQYDIRIETAVGGSSFPSGHVAGYVCLFGFLFYLAWALMKPTRVRLLILIVCGTMVTFVGFSRIYEGHHWASDVLGGYGLGFGWLGLCILGYRRWEAWHLARLQVVEHQDQNTLQGQPPPQSGAAPPVPNP